MSVLGELIMHARILSFNMRYAHISETHLNGVFVRKVLAEHQFKNLSQFY